MAKTPTDIRSLARAHTVTAIRTLAGVMKEPKAPHAARVAAATALLDRGWGKPEQHVEIDETVHWVISEETMNEDQWSEAYADSMAAPAGASKSTH